MIALRFIASVIANAVEHGDRECPAFVEGWGEAEILIENQGIKGAREQWEALASQLTEAAPVFLFEHFAGFTAAMVLEETRSLSPQP